MSRYIDADKLKEELKHSGYCNNNWLDIEMYINNQPTAYVRENVRGKWVEEDDAIIHGHCSNCGWMSIWQETDVFGMNYCPNCGADMRGDNK